MRPQRAGGGLEDADVLVVAQKAVSKAEGRVVRLDDVEPSRRALELADDRDPATSRRSCARAPRLVRARPPLVITETTARLRLRLGGGRRLERQGRGDAGAAPARSRRVGRSILRERSASAPARRGRDRERLLRTPVPPGDDRRRARRRRPGTAARSPRRPRFGFGYELQATQIAVADELAGAAELVLGKVDGIPAAVIRGVDAPAKAPGADIPIPEERPLPVERRALASAASLRPITGANLKPWPLRAGRRRRDRAARAGTRRRSGSCTGTSPSGRARLRQGTGVRPTLRFVPRARGRGGRPRRVGRLARLVQARLQRPLRRDERVAVMGPPSCRSATAPARRESKYESVSMVGVASTPSQS